MNPAGTRFQSLQGTIRSIIETMLLGVIVSFQSLQGTIRSVPWAKGLPLAAEFQSLQGTIRSERGHQ